MDPDKNEFVFVLIAGITITIVGLSTLVILSLANFECAQQSSHFCVTLIPVLPFIGAIIGANIVFFSVAHLRTTKKANEVVKTA
jgi:uncharacterized membrane protein YdcZ (DUF606 family)